MRDDKEIIQDLLDTPHINILTLPIAKNHQHKKIIVICKPYDANTDSPESMKEQGKALGRFLNESVCGGVCDGIYEILKEYYP